jgi:hypothetical protein
VADDVEVILAAGDLVEVDVGVQDLFALARRSCGPLPLSKHARVRLELARTIAAIVAACVNVSVLVILIFR